MDFKEVCCNIRSCLNSSKSQLSLGQLLRDYHDVLGEAMPYRALGYNSAEALIRAVPNLRISSIRGEIFIDVKADEKTAHIASLVREQRSAKKKKRKPSRGTFYRGSAPPPRRPATMPPPRRSAPPPRSSEYYPSQRRDSTLQTSYPSYQSQRRPSPPRRIDRDNNYTQRDNNYTQRDNDYTQRDNNYTQRDNNYTQRDNYTQKDISSFTQRDRDNYSQRDRNNYTQRRDPVASYQNHRNPTAPIEISSDEENGYDYNNRRIKNYEEDIQRKYRAHPSQYDFSDPNEDNDDYGSDFDDCDEINSKMEELKVTVGKQRQVSINKPQLRSYPSNTSNEDDFGYSSMKTTTNRGGHDADRERYYQTISSDSYDCDDDEEEDDYVSSSTAATSTTTTTDRFDSAERYSQTSQGSRNRGPFSRYNRNDVYDTDDYSTEPYSTSGSRGRGYHLNSSAKGFQSSTSSVVTKKAPKSDSGDIKVTVPNGTGRARVVAFLLR